MSITGTVHQYVITAWLHGEVVTLYFRGTCDACGWESAGLSHAGAGEALDHHWETDCPATEALR